MSSRIAKVIAFAAAASGLVAATGVIASSRAATDSLVAEYAFNEGAGTVLHDSSGNGNDGTIANATWVTTGKYGGALSFNGSSSRVTVPDSASLHLSSAMTLEAWVDPATTSAAWRDVIYKGNDNYYLEGTSDQSGRPAGGGTFGHTYATTALTANTWAHLAVTYDKTTVRLYVNGSQVSSLAATGAIVSSTNPLSIGSDAIYGQYFSGLIDDVRVYNTALTQAQIQTDMTTPVAPPAPDTTPPTAPGTLTASAISSSRVDLSWVAATDNVAVTGYHIERCQGTGCSNFTEIGTATATSYSDTATVVAGTSYSYRVRANDAAGNLGPYSNTATATTPAGGTGLRKPINLVAPIISGPTVQGQTLRASTGSWTGSPTSYAYSWKDCDSSGAHCVGIAGATASTLTLLSSDVGHAIRVAVTATNTKGSTTAQSASTNLVQLGLAAATADTTPPSVPSGVGVSSAGQTSLAVAWSASSDNVGVTGYGVYRNGTLAGSPAGTGYTLTGLSCGTSYTVAVDAFDAAGNRSAKATITTSTAACPDAQAPGVPGGLVASFVTQSAVTLSWFASSDNVGVVGYDLLLGGLVVGTSAQTSYAFSGLSCGTAYTLGVDAFDAAGNRSAVASLIVTTNACADTSPPSAPANLAESASTSSSITAGWSASSDNVAVTGYRVFVDGSQAGTTATTSYTVTGLSCGSSHQVVVDAYDAAGNRSPQTSATMATAACPAPPPGDTLPPTTPTGLAVSSAGQTSLALSWNASSDNVGVAGYGVYKNGTLAASPAGTSYTLTGLTCGSSYTVAVDGFDAAGNRSGKATITTSTAACPDTQAPTAPTGVTLATRTATSISISWTASTDNVGVAGYDLYRAGSAVGTATSTAYTFTGLTCNTNYTLAVDAYDAAGNKSAQATTAIATSACPDTTPPSTPTGLATSGVGQTSLTLSWNASTDNVGVTGYRLFVNGTQVGTSTTTSYAFSALTCGTSYTLGVAAVDAAGNVSTAATTSGQTSACSTGGANVYVAQASAGSGDGSSCANAKPATFFNTASNWGAGHTIAPGTIVGLCGTITSTLTAQSSGTAGNPITIYFTLGARISQPVCPYASDGSAGCLVISNLGYITVDGGTNGIIESTANGTNLANHASSTGIGARACNNCTIENLTVQNIYVIANPDNHWGTGGLSNSNTNCVNYSGVNWSIHDNTFHDAGWCLYEYSQPAGTDSADIYHNNIYNIDHGWIITGAGNYGKLVFRDNHMHDLGTWDPCTACHHDGIHCFFGSNGNTFSSGPFIYNNVFDGTVGSVDTAWIYLEANPSSGCSSSGSHWYIFNNIITSSDEVPTNGYIGSDGTYAAKTYMYNNTISGPGLGHYGANNAACVFVVSVFENNADGGCARIVSTSGANPLDYNAYANGQSNSSSSGNCWPMVNNCDFTGWKSASGDDAHSVYNYQATVGSNAAGIGTNLTSLCTGDLVPLCSDINGKPRPFSGTWTAGATN